MSIRFRRGLSVNRPSITPQAGEPLYDVDTHKLYVGDGATAGGVPVDTDGGIDTYVRTVNGSDGDVTVNKSTVGLGNVNNTSDANKPVSTAQAAALALKADASSLSSVATSGSYNSLSDKPTIPAAQVQADWGAANGVAHILNKPNLAAVATTGSYNDLTNKPTIPVITGKADITYVDAQDTSVASTAQSNLTAHTSNTSNPHSVTKAQVGLGNVDNTADANKPVSTATQTALDGKFTQRTITGTTNQVTVTNGDGVSGNPTLSLPQNIHTGASPTFAGLTSTGSVAVTGTPAADIATFRDSSNATYLTISQYGKATFSGQISSWGNSYPGADSTYTLGTSSLYWSNTYTDRLYLNSTAYLDGATAGELKATGIFTADNIKRGSGFPNGVVTANVGTIYVDTAVTNGASSWIKKSGTGNTGWQVLEGDTGWRDITSLFGTQLSTANPNDYGVWVLRKGNVISLNFKAAIGAGYTGSVVALPFGFKSGTAALLGFDILNLWQTAGSNTGQVQISSTFGFVAFTSTAAGTRYYGSLHTLARSTADNVWPATLPGTQISAPGTA